MSGFHRLFRRASDPDDVIPADSPWYWRWGLPGLKASIRYRRLASGKFDDLQDNEYGRLAAASEPYESARFACLYGREGGRRLREYINHLRDAGIMGPRDIRHLMRSGDLRCSEQDEGLHIRSPWVAFAVGCVLLALSVGVLMLLTLRSWAVIGAAYEAVPALAVLLALWGYIVWEFHRAAWKPFAAERHWRQELIRTLRLFRVRSGPRPMS